MQQNESEKRRYNNLYTRIIFRAKPQYNTYNNNQMQNHGLASSSFL